jgi:hypothetical protein
VQAESPLAWRLHEKTRKINQGVVLAPTFFGRIYGASVDDDPADPRTWIKANPSLIENGGFLDKEKIQKEDQSHLAEGDLSSFNRYFLNTVSLSGLDWRGGTKNTPRTTHRTRRNSKEDHRKQLIQVVQQNTGPVLPVGSYAADAAGISDSSEHRDSGCVSGRVCGDNRPLGYLPVQLAAADHPCRRFFSGVRGLAMALSKVKNCCRVRGYSFRRRGLR